jgi:O-antigen/teichoic acid export membrane protein
MSSDQVTKNIWRNSVSNYVCIGIRMLFGLLMFRMLYQHLRHEEFGFWSLLWSVFGYGILLDFGFGFAAVKRVAELSAEEKWDDLSRVLSTIFYLYTAIALVIVAVVLFGSDQIISIFQVSNTNKESFRDILVIFFIGMGLVFPVGIFPEILIGLQKIFLTNIIFSVSIISNFVLLFIATHYNWGIKSYLMIALYCGFVPCLVCAIFALRSLPHVKILPNFFSWKIVSNTMKFSLFAYVSTLSNLILTKTDQLVLSTTLAVSAIAIYQAGAKVAEMFTAFAQQLPDTFSPAAAHLHAKGDKIFLQKLLINGTRFSVMIATPVYFICAFYMEGILRVITGDKIPSNETFWIGETLLLWGYIGLITQSVSKRIFMMCGHEKKLMWLGVGEAFLNLALSIALVMHFKNVLCVAIGSLIATTVFGWFYLWPWAAREANLTALQLAKVVLFPIWLACLPQLVFVIAGRFTPWLNFRTNIFLFLAQALLAMILAAVCLWRSALTAQEKEMLTLKFGRFFTRFSLV